MNFDNAEDLIRMTPLWTGERFENGRPKVPEDILRRMAKIDLEEAWGPLWGHGYKYQYEGEFKTVHPDRILVGRAVTAVMVPMRPDLHQTLLDYGHEQQGRAGFFNQWMIDELVEDDIVVVDLFDKIYQGTFVGGNLTTAIAARTKRGGSVIWGGIRDVQQIMEIDEVQTYYRGMDPTGIGDVTMTGLNVPCRIGKAICMPGDVVLGTPAGVLFIPPHLAEECVVKAEKSRVRDKFGFERLKDGTYSTAQIDTAWSIDLWQDFLSWFKQSEIGAQYEHLKWNDELEEARKREGEGPSSEIRL